MAVDGEDLLINRSFGYDIRRYSLVNFSLAQSPRAYLETDHICVTTIQLNSKKILALAISIGDRQMIDLVNLNTDRLIRRITLDSNENLLYPIDLQNSGQWFAKTCVPCVNISHCLISSEGQVTRLNLFPHQDNFIRSLRMSADNRWLLVGRQHALELYHPYTSLLPLVTDLVGFSSLSLKWSFSSFFPTMMTMRIIIVCKRCVLIHLCRLLVVQVIRQKHDTYRVVCYIG